MSYIQSRLIRLIDGRFNRERLLVQPHMDLSRDLKLDSLDLVELAISCEDEFQVTIDDLDDVDTVAQLLALIIEKKSIP